MPLLATDSRRALMGAGPPGFAQPRFNPHEARSTSRCTVSSRVHSRTIGAGSVGATLYEGFQSAALAPVASKRLSSSSVVLGTTYLPHMQLKLARPRPRQQWDQPGAVWVVRGRPTSHEANESALQAASERAFIGAQDHHTDQASLTVRHTQVVVQAGHTTRTSPASI